MFLIASRALVAGYSVLHDSGVLMLNITGCQMVTAFDRPRGVSGVLYHKLVHKCSLYILQSGYFFGSISAKINIYIVLVSAY